MAIISNCAADAIKDAATALINGDLVAFPTETVYGLGADATNQSAVKKIYQVKGRPADHPLIVHISNLQYLDRWARQIPEYAIKLARNFWPGPMTLILPRTELAKDFITGGQETVAIRIPAHTLANKLLEDFESMGGLGVVAPSANRFGKVSPTTSDAVTEELGKYLSKNDRILDGGNSEIGIESTIINCTQDRPVILRPGFITIEMVESSSSMKVGQYDFETEKIKAPGLLEAHYSPNAQVILNGVPKPGDGFIALSSVPTPDGSIRLASPRNNDEYAKILYSALRMADNKGLKIVQVIPPLNEGIGLAINNRLIKASHIN